MHVQGKYWSIGAARRFFAALRLIDRPVVDHLRFGYEKAGHRVFEESIPWNAESVLLEALVWVPRGEERLLHDFTLYPPSEVPQRITSIRSLGGDMFLLSVALPPLAAPTLVKLCWQIHTLARTTLPYQSADDFLDGVSLQSPATMAYLAGRYVPCRALVAGQCRTLLACGLLRAPGSLLPASNFDLSVEVVRRGRPRHRQIPLTLTGSQLGERDTLVSVRLPLRLDHPGSYTLRWLLGNRVLAEQPLRILSPKALRRSLYLVDCRYACRGESGELRFHVHLPRREGITQLGPAFRLASRVPGMAALASLEVRGQTHEARVATRGASLVLVTDGPTDYQPLMLPVEDFRRLDEFHLVAEGRDLGMLAGCRRQVARFTAEGGYRLPPDFDWMPVPEDELAARLNTLLDIEGPPPSAASGGR